MEETEYLKNHYLISNMTTQEIKQTLYKIFPELMEKLTEEEKQKILSFILAVKEEDVANYLKKLSTDKA